jgi:hypothetical protein
MKKIIIVSLGVLLSLSQQGPLNASSKMKVTYAVPIDDSSFNSPGTFAQLKNSSESIQNKKKLQEFLKTKTMKANVIKGCKSLDSFNTRVKILDARNSTAGLANLNSVSAGNFRIVEEESDTPDYSDEEYERLFSMYDSQEDWPDYVEYGYVSYYLEATCFFSGTVSITASNAYRIILNGKNGPEYSKTELAKQKWSITLQDS